MAIGRGSSVRFWQVDTTQLRQFSRNLSLDFTFELA